MSTVDPSKGSTAPPPMSTSDPSKGGSTTGGSKGSSTPPPMSTSDPSKGGSTTSGGRGASTTGSPGRGRRRIHPLRRRLQMEATMDATFSVAVTYTSMEDAEDASTYINSASYTE